MTLYSIKGKIGFIVFAILLFLAIISGDGAMAGDILLYGIGGMIVYFIVRSIARAFTGFDPHDGSTK